MILCFFKFIFFTGGSYVIVKRDLKLQSELSNFDLFFPKKFESSNISLNYLNQSKCKFKQTTSLPFNNLQHLFLMPPPNITGKLHLGHCLIFTIQDALHRYYLTIKQQSSYYLAGLDHAGLATHQKILDYINELQIENNDFNYQKYSQLLTEQNKTTIINQINMLNMDSDMHDDSIIYTMDNDYQNLVLNIYYILKQQNMIVFDKENNELFIDLPKMLSETDLIDDIENRYVDIQPKTEIGQLMNFLNNIENWSISRDIDWGLQISDMKNLRFDTWFNSSLYPIASCQKLDLSILPNIEMITGRDILFFWCAKMLIIWNWLHKKLNCLTSPEKFNLCESICSIIKNNKYPFRKIFLTGLIRDKHNRKFSKSLGNGIDSIDIIQMKNSSPDALRLFMLSKASHYDMKISQNDEELFASQKFLNKVWQSARFLFMQSIMTSTKLADKYHLLVDEKTIKFIKQFDDLIEKRNFIDATRQFKHFYKEYFCDVWIEDAKNNIKLSDAKDEQISQILAVGFANMKLLLSRLSIFCPEISQTILLKIDDLCKN